LFSTASVTDATKYHCRVSRYYDFSVITHEDNTLTIPIYSETLTGGSYKYYYQWCAYVGAWQKWQEVQSFERLTGGADLTVTSGKWMMFEASERATYTLVFTSAPQYSYTESQLYRTDGRNLAGDILSEFWTTKGKIRLEFKKNNTISRSEKDQVMRYFGNHCGDVYLACAPSNGEGYYRKLWKVWFTKEPEVEPLDGNEKRFMMVLDLEER